jgi:hypothetical protein
VPEHSAVEANGLWLAGQYGIEEDVLDAIAKWLQDNIPDFGSHEIHFAHYCTKLRVDEQRGSSIRLSPGAVQVVSFTDTPRPRGVADCLILRQLIYSGMQ